MAVKDHSVWFHVARLLPTTEKSVAACASCTAAGSSATATLLNGGHMKTTERRNGMAMFQFSKRLTIEIKAGQRVIL